MFRHRQVTGVGVVVVLAALCFGSACLAAVPEGPNVGQGPAGNEENCLQLGFREAALRRDAMLARIPVESSSNSHAYETDLKEIEAEYGALDERLVPYLLGLGRAYAREGRAHDAARNFQQALLVTRANQGLYAMDQAPIIDLLIKSRSAAGEWMQVADAYDLLLWVYRRNFSPDDPRMLPVLKEYRRWSLESYNRDTGRSLDILFEGAQRAFREGTRIIEKCTGDRHLAVCFWRDNCCPNAKSEGVQCPATPTRAAANFSQANGSKEQEQKQEGNP